MVLRPKTTMEPELPAHKVCSRALAILSLLTVLLLCAPAASGAEITPRSHEVTKSDIATSAQQSPLGNKGFSGRND